MLYWLLQFDFSPIENNSVAFYRKPLPDNHFSRSDLDLMRNSHLALPWVPPPHLLNIAPHPWTVVAATNTVSASTARCLISAKLLPVLRTRVHEATAHGLPWLVRPWSCGSLGSSIATPAGKTKPSQPIARTWHLRIFGDSWRFLRTLEGSPGASKAAMPP